MKFFLRTAMRLGMLLYLTTGAWSQCVGPSSPGVVICSPTNDSTVVYNNEVSIMSTPAQGASIATLAVYDNNALIAQGKSSPGLNIYDGGMYNGQHHVVAIARDTDGNTYRAESNFYVTGQGYGPCALPKSPGIVICNPPTGAVYGTYVTADVAATGQSKITNLSFYLNGKLIQSVPNQNSLGIAVQLANQGVQNTLLVTATDASGNKYSAEKILVADYTYGLYSCVNICTPGINVVSPQPNAYVGNTFNLNAQIVDNTNPITEMKAFIDSNVVATSNSANLQHEVSEAPDGTHILTIQGRDSEGIEYFIQENINIHVHD
jgi:hypothetical protein